MPDMDISGGDSLKDSTTISELNNGFGIAGSTSGDESSGSVSGGDGGILLPPDDSPIATVPPITAEGLLSGISFGQEESPYYFSTVSSGSIQPETFADNTAVLTELTGMNDRLTLIISFLVLGFIFVMGKCIYKFFGWFF